MTDWTKMVDGDKLAEAAKERKSEIIKTKIPNSQLETYLSLGYEVKTPGKSKTVIQTRKSYYEIFENELWCILYRMGFTVMNYDNTFELDLDGDTKQIDILAVDDETVLVIECKSSEIIDKTTTFKKELESIKGYMPDVIKALRKQYPKRKIKHIFATKNYMLGEADKNRIKEMGSFYFNYDTVLYYRDLTAHLKSAAKYQLLGNLFQKQKIENLETRVNALKGTMGGLDYYSFLIEPSKLLKLAYVLHRNNANISNFPTYQRLIKKERLKSVKEYINSGNFFPNSLICSIDGSVKFEKSSQVIDGSLSCSGILTLPQTYMSMYVIDGQHRLYGYSESNYASNNVVPVVAFVNMSKDKQVKMFMDINENQKPVNKTLKNTLNADLLWDSENPKQAQEALAIKVAEALGEDRDSPLLGRILTGEESKTDLRCITTEAIKNAIKDSSFLNQYDKKGIKVYGSFDKNNNDKTYPFLVNFLKNAIDIVKKENEPGWAEGGNGYLAINNTIYAIIRIISDIVEIKIKGPADGNSFNAIETVLTKFAKMIKSLDIETLKSLKLYGDGGKKIAWRTLQVRFNSIEPTFTNKDLELYIESTSTKNNEDSDRLLKDIENHIRDLFKKHYNEKEVANLSNSVINTMMDYEKKKQIENLQNDVDGEIDKWDAVSFEQFISLAKAIPAVDIIDMLSTENFSNSKTNIVDWLTVFEAAQKKIQDNKPVSQKDYDLIRDVHFEYFGDSNE